jgi:hypothetical protein
MAPLSHAIDIVKAAGYSVYMRREDCTWMIYSDGKNIGYLQRSWRGGYDITTVHKPNTSSGTGFKAHEVLGESELADKLKDGFIFAPLWARENSSVRKYRDIEEYLNADDFNRQYVKV